MDVSKSLIIALIFNHVIVIASLELKVKTAHKCTEIRFLDPFWQNTGFCPTSGVDSRKDFMLSYDEDVNLAVTGSVPDKGIKHVRIHWLLDLVSIRYINESGFPVFAFDHLDLLISRLHENGLSLGFELMGNPSKFFCDFSNQSDYWILLLSQILDRYIYAYGADYVKSWRFELLNEPDLKMYNTMNFTLETYLKYFDASQQVLGKLSGPAGLFKENNHPICWGFLNHCNLNDCRLKRITFHKKGDETGSQVLQNGIRLIEELHAKFPNLNDVPVGNDEADILTGWHHPKEWRADVRYAALVLQVVIGHVQEIQVKRNYTFDLLSNDNAFLSFYPNQFTQRTLLARFQMNNTIPKHVQFFKKPVYAVMGLLSLSGKILLKAKYRPGQPGISYICTRDSFRVTLLASIVNDSASDEAVNAQNNITVNVTIKMAVHGKPGYAVAYLMDNTVSNPYAVWRKAGKPDYPDKSLRRKMRQAEEFKKLSVVKIRSNQNYFKYRLAASSVPTILAINICYQGTRKPGPVTNLRYKNVTNNEIILLWSDVNVNSKCLWTYLIEFKNQTDRSYRRINGDTIFLSYHFDGFLEGEEVNVSGMYRISAIDYWKRSGPYSFISVRNDSYR